MIAGSRERCHAERRARGHGTRVSLACRKGGGVQGAAGLRARGVKHRQGMASRGQGVAGPQAGCGSARAGLNRAANRAQWPWAERGTAMGGRDGAQVGRCGGRR